MIPLNAYGMRYVRSTFRDQNNNIWLAFFQKVSASLIQVITSLPGSISPQASLHGIEPLAVTQEVIYGFLLMILAYTA